MKRLATLFLIALAACSPASGRYTFVPQIEMIDGSVPQTLVFSLPDKAHCDALKQKFEEDMKNDPTVLVSRGDCVPGLVLHAPTGQLPHGQDGSV